MQDNILSKDYYLSKKRNATAMSNIVDLLKHLLHFTRNCLFVVLILVSFLVSITLIDSVINQFRSEKLPALIDTYEIVSPSMTPTIKVNEAIMVRRVDYKSLKKGDIITFKSSDSRLNGMVITHRINEIVKDKNGKISFITKGDNNYSVDDAMVLPENIYGKVVTKIPFYSTIKKVISNPLIIISIITILVVLIINRNKKNKRSIYEDEIELLSFEEEKLEII